MNEPASETRLVATPPTRWCRPRSRTSFARAPAATLWRHPSSAKLSSMRRELRWVALALTLTACQQRTIEQPLELEQLRTDTCESSCLVYDSCDPDRFAGMDPPDCFERCMTLLPRLHEVNQCGSREIIWLECVASLSCEEFGLYQEGNDLVEGQDFSAPCVTELERASSCSQEGPFNLDEPVPPTPY